MTLLADLNKLKRGSLEVLFELTHVTTLLEQILGGLSELVFEDLLAFEVSTFSSLLELVTVVLVANLQVVQGVQKCFDFLLAFLYLAIEFITESLKLLLLLGSLDNVVGLGVFTSCLDLATA